METVKKKIGGNGRRIEMRKKKKTRKKKGKTLFWTMASDAGAEENRWPWVCWRGCERLCVGEGGRRLEKSGNGGGREATRKMGVK